ncbi:MAG: hypothetical protein EP330_18040 [Deltaproteobacteria bacterium]|nr:MAG: hypothetical protein EP330_18040 [Deltaproteobacteria bacterium]
MRILSLAFLVACAGVQDDAIGDPTDTGETTDTGESADTGNNATFPQVSGGDSATAQFGLTFEGLTDADADGDWEVGETALLEVVMTNHGADDFNYPGCELRSDDLASGTGEFSFFGLEADGSNICSWTLTHLADAQPGDVVEVEVIADRLNCTGDCPEENPLLLRFRLVAAGG